MKYLSGIFACLVFILSFFYVKPVFASSSGPRLFKEYYCIDCHVIDGHGGTVGPNLSSVGKKRSLSWIKNQILHPGSHFTVGSEVTVNGRTYINRMPGFKNISAGDLDSLAAYVKNFPGMMAQKAPSKITEGQMVFEQDNCISCHEINGKGGTVGPDLSTVGAKRSLAWIKAQILHPGSHYILGTPASAGGKTFLVIMPDFKDMPEYQLNALARYLSSLK